MSFRVALLLVPGMAASGAMGVADLLATANRISRSIAADKPPPFVVDFVSADDKPVLAGNAAVIHPSIAWEQCLALAPHALWVCPPELAGAEDLETVLDACADSVAWLRQESVQLPLWCSHCAGHFLLAEAGLIDGRKVACSWWLQALLHQRYPAIEIDRDAMVCVDTQAEPALYSAAASSAYQDLCLQLIEKHCGKPVARLVAKYQLIDNQRQRQGAFAQAAGKEDDDAVVVAAEAWLKPRLAEPLRMGALAEALGLSQRSVLRHFQHSRDETPQAFLARLRIDKAKVLLETTDLALPAILQRCGYGDESAFRRQFKRLCGLSPREYRRRFRQR